MTNYPNSIDSSFTIAPVAVYSAPGMSGLPQINNIIDLRAEAVIPAPISKIILFVSGYYIPGDGGGGQFYWDPASALADDSGTVIIPNSGGTGRWIRLTDGIINVKYFGAKGDGINDDCAAIQSAHDSFPSKGGILFFPAGTYALGSRLNITKPTVMKLGIGSISALTNFNGPLIKVSSNLLVYGISQNESKFLPPIGHPAFLLSDTWSPISNGGLNDGDSVFHIENVGCTGGSSLLDAFSVTTFNEGSLVVRHCLATATTDYPIKLNSSVYYGRIEDNHLNLCKGGIRLKDNTETKCYNNLIIPAQPIKFTASASINTSSFSLTLAGLTSSNIGDTVVVVGAGSSGKDLYATMNAISGSTITLDISAGSTVTNVDAYVAGFGYLLEGAHHVDITNDEICSFSPTQNADIRIMGTANAANGICTITGTKFAAERDYWLRNRPKIEVYNPVNKQFAPVWVKLINNRIYGPQFLLLESIGRNGSNVATATVTCNVAQGHGLQVGDIFHIVQVTDHSFCGTVVVTAIGVPFLVAGRAKQTVSWSSTGSIVAQSNLGGAINSAQISAISLVSPVAQMLIEGNVIDSFTYSIDDTSAVTDQLRGSHGLSVYRNNFEKGPIGLFFQTFKSSFGRGFSIVESGAQSLGTKITNFPREIETAGIQNRVLYSEDNSHWGHAGVIIASATDDLGGSTATLLTRSGINQVVTGNPGLGSAITEGISINIDNSSLPAGGYIKFKAKAGSLNSLWIGIYDGSTGFEHPGSQRIIPLGSNWNSIKIPFQYNSGASVSLYMCPGGQDSVMGTCYIEQIQVSDFDCDYIKTSGSAITNQAGVALQRDIKVNGIEPNISGGAVNIKDFSGNLGLSLTPVNAGVSLISGQSALGVDAAAVLSLGATNATSITLGRTGGHAITLPSLTASNAVVTDGSSNLASLGYSTSNTASTLVERDSSSRVSVKGVISSGTVPSITDVSSTLGAAGTFSFLTGSNDMAGIIVLNPGAGAGTYTIFDLHFSASLPGNIPNVQLTLQGQGSDWGGGGVLGLSNVGTTTVTNSVARIFAKNINGAGVGGTVQGVALAAGADQYRIHYSVTLM